MPVNPHASHVLREGNLTYPPAVFADDDAPAGSGVSTGTGVLGDAVGLGVDLVHIPSFAEQLGMPGTRFGSSFAPSERRAARLRAGQTVLDEAYHLAARWAGKEAFVKAWSSAILGNPPVVDPDAVDMAQIQIPGDAYGRPFVMLAGEIAEAFATSLPGAKPLISLSHDGDYAIAICHIVSAQEPSEKKRPSQPKE